MRAPILFSLSLSCCAPVGEVYSVRSAQLDVSCADTGACTSLEVLGVPFEREESVTFDIVNEGERALVVELSVEHPSFGISPESGNVPASGSGRFTLTYAPRGIEDVEATLVIQHNAGGPAHEMDLLGTTDPDADDDGFQHLEAPDGDDCNDFNAQVNPGAEESWYDGIDQDCDGASDYDQDGDGHDIHTRPEGDDCDDENPRIHPGAKDPVGDEVDQDCDGEDG
jgi:hypothetical protein